VHAFDCPERLAGGSWSTQMSADRQTTRRRGVPHILTLLRGRRGGGHFAALAVRQPYPDLRANPGSFRNVVMRVAIRRRLASDHLARRQNEVGVHRGRDSALSRPSDRIVGKRCCRDRLVSVPISPTVHMESA
jgi:hypothetical protein